MMLNRFVSIIKTNDSTIEEIMDANMCDKSYYPLPDIDPID